MLNWVIKEFFLVDLHFVIKTNHNHCSPTLDNISFIVTPAAGRKEILVLLFLNVQWLPGKIYIKRSGLALYCDGALRQESTMRGTFSYINSVAWGQSGKTSQPGELFHI